MHRIHTLIGIVALLITTIPAALAHHGWAWTSGKNIELTGIIETAALGNPHGILTIDADSEVWTVEVGQPWRHARAGLNEALYKPGTEIIIIGEPSADLAEKRMKAERVIIDGTLFELYPDRN